MNDVENHIELTLKNEVKFPELKDSQFALTFEQLNTGKRLSITKELHSGEEALYHVFDTLKEAKIFAKTTIEQNATIACWIATDFNTAISYIDINGEKDFELEKTRE